MKILMVSSYLPYPLFSGGHIRLYNLIKLLSKKHKITLVCEKRGYQKESDIKEVEKFCEKVITFDRKTQWSFENIVKTGFSFSPFLIVGHTIPAMKRELRELLEKDHFDLIHVETSYVMQNLPETKLPIVLVEHNIEYLVYKRFVETAPIPLKPLLYIDIFKLRNWEEKVWEKVTKLVAVSEVDMKIMDRIRKDVVIVQNGVGITKFKVQSSKFKVNGGEKRVLFIGDFKWVQNRDAAEWILKEIWPKIKMSFWSKGEARAIESHQRKRDAIASLQHDVSLKLWIVGRKIPENIKFLGGENVIFDEDAPEDTSLIYQKADILLAPIRVGGGTSFKILEAMASGVPVITTSLGNAMNAKENSEIVIANDSQEFVQKIGELLGNEEFYEKIATNARRLIEQKFNWEKISQKLSSVYESVFDNH